MAEGADTDDKTEDPTQKKLDDALKKGDVVKSQEVNNWFMLGGATLVLMSFAGSMSEGLTTIMRGLMANAHKISMDGPALPSLFMKLGSEMLSAVAMPFVVLVLAALVGNLIQHQLVWSTEGVSPKFSKVSPMAGFKRLFSKQSLANFAKGIVKLLLLGAIMVALMWPEQNRMEGLVRTDVMALLPFTQVLALKMMGAVVALLGVVAAADYFFQYRTWFTKQKMSLQEIKEEYKQAEGDPHVKGQRRNLRLQKSRQRMMAAVPKASVIITNPTHYAVALQYERGMEAPICVAKGVDAIALKIREIGGKHDIPIVENVPLARALHATVEIDEPVPAEHYKAVAEVISYVMKLRGTFRK
ncbi:MAG: flagellar biosynthesis protein FlhB [Pseudolabrys sp.]|nr:flagellar biosynthesis protein FlhB [Pseudolabrys sp.]